MLTQSTPFALAPQGFWSNNLNALRRLDGSLWSACDNNFIPHLAEVFKIFVVQSPILSIVTSFAIGAYSSDDTGLKNLPRNLGSALTPM